MNRPSASSSDAGSLASTLREGVDRLGLAGRRRSLSPARLLALAGIAVGLGAFLWVLRDILVVTGDPARLTPIAAGAALAGTVLARLVRPRIAALVGTAAVAGGLYVYVASLPGGFGFLVLATPMVEDAWALLGGLSVLRIVNADVWALAAAPGPVFLAWYLGVRRRYVAAGAVAGGALGVLVLTGDATTVQTLAGVAGLTAAAAFGDCDRRGEPLRNADGVVVVVTTMVVLSLFVGVVPGAAGMLLSTDGADGGGGTMESSLVHAGDSLAVTGAVELSPEVRYTVEADEPANWRVGTYDRYTGGGWVSSGERRTYEGGRLAGPPGESGTLEQRYTAETAIATLPSANQPTGLRDAPVPVLVTDDGSFQPASPLEPGESYRTESEVPVASAGELRAADTDYPDGVEDRYTQLPSSTPDRVGERTDQLTADAETPYDTARVLEQWFVEEYDYSLDVERPRDDVADSFLFEMDEGYCTYFATTMVTMLRTQGIPARFAVGYTPGQQVDDDEWVVRGYNSHAWVEVYFPEHGWIEFDPTPPEPREQSEREALDDARDVGGGGVDTNDSTDSEFDEGTPEPSDDDRPDLSDDERDDTVETPFDEDAPGGDDGDGGDGDGGLSLPTVPVPTREQLGFGLLVLVGLVAATRRSGVDGRLYRELWLRRRPSGDPGAVVAGAYHRVVHLEERDGREKRPGETPRQFLADADDRARRVGALYERERYGPGVDEAAAEEALAHLGELLEERSLTPYPLRKRGRESR